MKVFLLFDGLLVCLFLTSYAARYVPPTHFWGLQMVAIGLPYLSILILLITGSLAMGHWGKLLVLHLVMVVLILIRFMPPLSLHSWSIEAESAQLGVMSFNAPDRSGLGEAAGDEMMRLVRDAQPDMLCLQQTLIRLRGSPPKLHPASHLVPLFDSLHYATILPSVLREHRLMQPILSHLELENQTEIVLQVHPDDKAASKVIRTEFEWQEKRAVVYNLHLRSFGRRKPWRDERGGCLFDPSCWKRYLQQYRQAILIRAWEARQIRPMLDKETLPVVVCGDFNSTPHQWVYKYLARGLTDAFAVAGHGWGATYSSKFPFVRIDYVLVSPEWKVMSARTGKAYFSDHLPVIVKLRFANVSPMPFPEPDTSRTSTMN